MPGTAKDLGVTDPLDAESNVNGGTRYIKQMLKQFGTIEDALGAYNWGPGNMRKWIKAGRKVSKMPKETKRYIQKIKRFMNNAAKARTKASSI